MFEWKLSSEYIIIVVFFRFGQFSALLDHTKGKADVSKMYASFSVNCNIFREHMHRVIRIPKLVAPLITSQESSMVFLASLPPHNIGCSR